MTNSEILTKANEVVRGASFTKIGKVKGNGSLFLIVALSNGAALYGSHTSDAVYVDVNNQMLKLV